jgi:methionyl-tRNA formyltransferase
VVFFGTPDFAVPSLDSLVAAGHQLLTVVAQPDRPKGRGQQLAAPPTVVRARELGIPVRQPKAVRSGPFFEWFTQAAGADVAVVVAYGRILPRAILEAPRFGCINVHGSLLPHYRGAAPIQRALLAGDQETGVCTMQMSEGLDEGDVLLCRRTPIGEMETGPELWARLAQIGAEALVETLAGIESLPRIPQDHARATFAPPLTKADGLIDWSRPARAIHAQIRGVDPWPGAFSSLRGEVLKIWRARPVEAPSGEPGTLIEVGRRLVVATGDGALELLEVQLAGKSRRSGAELCNGARLSPGLRLGGSEADLA